MMLAEFPGLAVQITEREVHQSATGEFARRHARLTWEAKRARTRTSGRRIRLGRRRWHWPAGAWKVDQRRRRTWIAFTIGDILGIEHRCAGGRDARFAR